MQIKNFNTYFFFILLMGVSLLTVWLFKPFWLSLFLAAVLSIVFYPTYDFFLSKTGNRKGISAFIASLVAVLVFLVPLFLVITLMVNELFNIYQNFGTQGHLYQSYIAPLYQKVSQSNLLVSIGFADLISQDAISKTISQFGQGALALLQKTYQSIATFLFVTIMVFLSIYYFLINGKRIVAKLMFLSPLKNRHEQLLIEKMISTTRATFKGTLVVSFVQGFIGGLVFAIAGIPSAIVWAVVMVIFSLIPMVGSSIIWFPAGLIMLFSGRIWEGAMILIVGLSVISLIDNVLRPELVGKDTQMHPLLVLFSTLGGLALFGFMGFLIGPIIMALFVSMWDIYAVEFSRQLKKFNT